MTVTMTVWYAIKTMDGRTISRTHGLPIDGKWDWICHNVSEDADCAYSSIDIQETDNGDIIIVHNKPYARVITSLHDA